MWLPGFWTAGEVLVVGLCFILIAFVGYTWFRGYFNLVESLLGWISFGIGIYISKKYGKEYAGVRSDNS